MRLAREHTSAQEANEVVGDRELEENTEDRGEGALAVAAEPAAIS